MVFENKKRTAIFENYNTLFFILLKLYIAMKLHFKISYFTQWGQSLYVVGNIPELGNDDVSKAVPMHFVPSETWELALPVTIPTTTELHYRYFLLD